ncbi:MAG TPA: MFS transporter [Acetobacteraceae bacterium]
MKPRRNVIATTAVALPRANSALAALIRLTQFGPFQVRSFRFQWPADLLTSWGFEMENLILGWYVLAQTGSVLLLTLFGSLQYVGTLIAPLIGMAGDRMGHRIVLCMMRAWYAALSLALMTLAFAGVLRPEFVIILAALSGLVRMSDLAMRNALVAETVPVERFVSAMGAERMTSDSARALAPLAGAGLFVALGMGRAYVAIVTVYVLGFLLTRGVGGARGVRMAGAPRTTVWRDLRQGMSYVWDSPTSMAALVLAFLVNATAFPFTSGLLPYVAREIYRIDETGLGSLISAFAIGSLLGSLVVSLASRVLRPGRMMIVFAIAWYCVLLVWGFIPGASGGRVALLVAGLAQSLSLVPMAVMLLHGAGEFRGRVMGLRMMAIYGLPFGLMAAGALIERIGFPATTALYAVIGIVATIVVAWHWRRALWAQEAPANAG